MDERKVLSGRFRWLNGVSHPVLICLLLAGATLIAFWAVAQSGFIEYDDQDYVTSNPRVLAGLTWDGVAWAFRAFYASNWHPLTWLSHMLDVELFGKGPAGPHCVNLAFHIANTILLFLLLLRMTNARWRSAFVAALFALHPLHVESVAWISERKDVLSTFFWMLTLLAYSEYAARSRMQKSRAVAYYGLALIFFALGLMSKPMLVTLPFVLLLLDCWPLQRFHFAARGDEPSTVWPLLREKLPFFLLTILACAATLLAQRESIQPLENLPLADRIENSLVSYVRYLGKMLCPAGLAIPYPQVKEWPLTTVLLAVAVMAGVSAGVLLARRKSPFLLTGWFWFLGTLIPVIGLLQVGSQSMADRYTYIPLIGIFIMIAWGVAELAQRSHFSKVPLSIASVSIIVVCGIVTRQQTGYWRDTKSLFGHSVLVTQNNYVALTTMGVALFHEGKLPAAENYCRRAVEIKPNYVEALNNLGVVLAAKEDNESLVWYRRALQINPSHTGTLYNLGNELTKQKQYAEAITCFENVLQTRPDHYEARNNLANALVEVGRIDEAIAHYQRILKLQPHDLKVQKNLAAAFVKQGKFEQAIPLYRRAVKEVPGDVSAHYALGLALAVQGQWEEAIAHYVKTLEILPNNPEVEYNLGYAFRVTGRLDEAVLHLGRALQLRPNFPIAHYNLGCVLAAQGKPDDAILHVRESLRLNPAYQEARQKLEELTVLSKTK